MIHIRVYELLLFLLCNPTKTKMKMIENKVAAWRTESDGKPLTSYFLRDDHHALLAWLSFAGSTVIACRYQPSTVSNRSDVLYKRHPMQSRKWVFQQARVPDQARATLGDRSRILPRVSPPARTLNQLDTRMLGALGGLSGLHILDDPNRA